MRTQELFAFIKERYEIYQRRSQGQPKPWTKNPILQRYRFCNVYRELDTVTQWIRKRWREPHTTDRNMWFAMTVARLVNWPETLAQLGYPVPWNPEKFEQVLKTRADCKQQVFNGAYMIRSDKMPKAEYLAQRVLTPMWEMREAIGSNMRTLQSLYEALVVCNGMGSFLAGQVIADTKYTKHWRNARDWKTFAVSGPGSKRGLNRMIDSEVDAKWNEDHWYACLHELYKEIAPLIIANRMPAMHYQDLQNCLCEWDKYERVRLNEGRPKSLFEGV